MFHCIFDYNCGNSWHILIIVVPLGTGINVLSRSYRLSNFNLTMSPLYQIKLKITQNSRPLTAVRSAEPIVPDFRGKSFNVRFFPCLLESSFGGLLSENVVHYHGFYQKFIFKLSVVNFK